MVGEVRKKDVTLNIIAPAKHPNLTGATVYSHSLSRGGSSNSHFYGDSTSLDVAMAMTWLAKK